MNLLNAAKETWQGNYEDKRFTTSVQMRYGSLGAEGLFTETTAYDPILHIQLQSQFRSFCTCIW
jgi:dTDP-glucose 4,6-dehydratase